MAFPATNESKWPLYTAGRALRLLGGLFIFVAMVMVWAEQSFTAVPTRPRPQDWIPIAWLAYFAATGTLDIVCSIFVPRRRTWAITLALVITALQWAVTLLAFLLFFAVWREFGFDWGLLLFHVAIAVLLLILLMLASHLWRCYGSAILDGKQGFQPVMPVRIDQANESDRVK